MPQFIQLFVQCGALVDRVEPAGFGADGSALQLGVYSEAVLLGFVEDVRVQLVRNGHKVPKPFHQFTAPQQPMRVPASPGHFHHLVLQTAAVLGRAGVCWGVPGLPLWVPPHLHSQSEAEQLPARVPVI